jgi:hypothetical protein
MIYLYIYLIYIYIYIYIYICMCVWLCMCIYIYIISLSLHRHLGDVYVYTIFIIYLFMYLFVSFVWLSICLFINMYYMLFSIIYLCVYFYFFIYAFIYLCLIHVCGYVFILRTKKKVLIWTPKKCSSPTGSAISCYIMLYPSCPSWSRPVLGLQRPSARAESRYYPLPCGPPPCEPRTTRGPPKPCFLGSQVNSVNHW